MSLYTIRPLDDRTGFKGKPKRSAFTRAGDGWSRVSIPFSETRELLARELKFLSAKDVTLEVDVLPGQIRLDGELYASAKVNSPAVRLHFESDHGHLSYQTDAFTTWQDNVRAIALALEALRKVDRYGIGRGDEQYRGYLALEAGTGSTALGAVPAMTPGEARHVIGQWAHGFDYEQSNQLDGDPDQLRAAHKKARGNAHPDRNGGDRTGWDEVEKAAKVLNL